jgi:hypothetical protein
MPLTTVPPAASSTNLPPSKQQSIRARLVENGSALSYSNGSNINVNVLATKQSPLHFNQEKEEAGYSVTGEQFSQVNEAMNAYQDGTPDPLPLPSQLDLKDPITADPEYKPLYVPGVQTYKDKINFLNQP